MLQTIKSIQTTIILSNQFYDSLSCIVNCELLLEELNELHTLVRMYNVSSSSMVTECTSISSICDIMNAFPAAKQTMPQLNRLLKWYLTIPICSATAERTFSAMRRLKTWLRSKSSPTHLNNIMFGNIHKSRIDSLNISEIAKEFVNANDFQEKIFRTISIINCICMDCIRYHVKIPDLQK